MPFHGVLPERQSIFQPQPITDVGVSDAEAWRLNPNYRYVYHKLWVAESQGLKAAPCGVDPKSMGCFDSQLFVKPMINLAGMAMDAFVVDADQVPNNAGSFWCQLLSGEHSSSDCLVCDGDVVWFAHTKGSTEMNKQRPIYWHIGVKLPKLENIISNWIKQHLAGYSGLCNVELINDHIIEVHLRGSNGFFDFYGEQFIPAWVALVDGVETFAPPPAVDEGYVFSVFADKLVDLSQIEIDPDVSIQLDHHSIDRAAIIRSRSKEKALAVLAYFGM